MAGVLRSLLAPALKKLADKGENIAINRLPDTLLKEQGLRKDEIDLIAPNFEEVDTTVSKSGNTLITPQGLRELEEKIPTFKTTEETQYDRDQLDFERLETSEIGRDLDSELILGQMDELQRKREELITRGLEGGENLDPDELNKIELEAEMLQEEIQELDNIYGQSRFREDSVVPPQYKFDTFYKDITPSDVNDETYGMLVVRDPRDNQGGYSAHLDYLGRDNYSYHMRYDTDPDELALRVFEMQRDIVGQKIPSSNQYNIFKKFSSGDKWDKDNFRDANPGFWWKWADEGKDLAAFSQRDLEKIIDQVDNVVETELDEAIVKSTKEEKEEFAEELAKLNKLWNDLAKVDPKETGRKVPQLDYYQNLINRALVKADNEGLNKVKFFIGQDTPESIEYMGLKKGEAYEDLFKNSKDLYTAWENQDPDTPLGYLSRSFPIQNHYETVVANQIRKTAKKIGSSAIMDKKGYLVVALPAAGFTLPLYGEENKEASFIATAASKGMDRNEAKEMVNDRVSEFPFPVDKESNRENFNIGGRVLSSLKRKAS